LKLKKYRGSRKAGNFDVKVKPEYEAGKNIYKAEEEPA
jgi:hypothetical protein